MLGISTEIKQAIESAERKNLVLSFDDGTVIDNDDIAIESMELEQSISEEETLRFGGINSACFKVMVKGTTKEYKNLWFNASLNVGEYELPLGRFLVNSDIATSDRQYREIVAYDSLYGAMNKDVSEWYNGLTFPISIYDMRNSLFEYLGIEQVETVLINDSYMVDKTIDGNGISGHGVLSAICELNAVFGVMNVYGQFKYVQINNLVNSGLFPSETLYPSEDLYPQDIYDDCLSKADYKLGSLAYEEFSTQNITKIVIREEVNDVGVSVGEDGNTYAIEDNFLVYGDTEEKLTVVAQNIFDYAKHLTYTPASLKCNGKPWREVGDVLQVYANDRVFHMPIMNRVLKGIQALTDTYSAQGRETYEEQQEVGYKAEIKQLKSRTNVLTRTLDETRSEISRVETEVNMNGRNFLRNTSTEKVISSLYQWYALVSSKDKLNGQKMVLSFDAFYSTEKELTLSFSFGTIGNERLYPMSETVIVTGEEARYSVMLDTIEDFSDVKSIFIWSSTYASRCTLKNVKLEIGEATDYSIAPEDIGEKFENYSTTAEMNSAIRQSAENINLSVDEKLTNYSTTEEMNSAIDLKADSITLEVNKTIENLQQQIDGAIETFTGSEEPTLENYPANEWTTDEIKDSHIGDLYLVSSDNEEQGGFYYRFEKYNDTYQWTLLKDNEVAKALEEARKANEAVEALAEELEATNIDLNSKIEQTAEEISLSVSATYETKTDAESTKTSLQSQITQNASGISAEVTRAKDAESALSSRVTVTENGIATKVSKGSVSSEISQEADTITIDGDRFVLNATNIQIDKDGNVIILGKLTTEKGSSIGGWETDNNSIFNGSWGSTPPNAFMCLGSNMSYSIAGSAKINGWVFGAGDYFGVNKTAGIFATAGKIGGWKIYDNYLEATTTDGWVQLSPNTIRCEYKDSNGYTLFKEITWAQLVNLV